MVCSPHGPLLAGWPQERGASQSPRQIGVLCVCRDWDGGLGALRLLQLTSTAGKCGVGSRDENACFYRVWDEKSVVFCGNDS